MANETLQEFCAVGGGVRVDRSAGMIRGVKILGLESRNGRSYPAATLSSAVGLYEGAAVNVNHPRGNATSPRDYQDRIGRIRNVKVDANGLRADFQFNPKHPLAEQLIWDAEHSPENVGFSHNVEARTSHKGGKVIVEEIIKVQSVDLVADPATTRGLFEAADPLAEKRRIVEQAARVCGLPAWAIPPMNGGLAYRDKPLEILEYLVSIKQNLEAVGTLPRETATPKLPTVEEVFDLPDPAGVADFAEGITGRPTAVEQTKFCESMGISTKRGDGRAAKNFAREITG